MIPSLILSGPPGVAVVGGVPKAQEVVSYWPALLKKDLVKPQVALFDRGLKDNRTVECGIAGKFKASNDQEIQVAERPTKTISELLAEQNNAGFHPLITVALGRSGDKGDMANIGILARTQAAFEFLDGHLTAQVVKNLFQELCAGRVVRYRLPGLLGFNFLLEESLGGGGTMTLRTDAQGKTFAQALLRQRIKIPQEVLAGIDPGRGL